MPTAKSPLKLGVFIECDYSLRVKANCCVRYGGVLLHGDRFKHINNVARTLLQETGIGLEV